MRPADRLVVDASVAIKWYVPEPMHREAAALLASGAALFAPDLLVAELGNILWKKVRRGEVTRTEAEVITEAFATACPVTLRPSLPLLRAAVETATMYDRTVYDALYLTAAVAEGCEFITADERLVNALRGTPLESVTKLLA